MRTHMKLKRLVAAALTFVMTAALVPVSGAADSESVVLDARPNFSEEFVNATFVNAKIDGDNVALLTDTGDLWVCGVVAGLEDITEPVGFHKVATDVESFDFQNMVLSIVKTDSSLWATKDLNTYDGPKDGFHKIMDNVKQVSNSGSSGLALDYNGDVWAWIGEMAIFNFPVDVDDIPASYKKTSPWGVSVVKPYKVMSDVKKCLYVDSNGYFLKNDGTLLSTGSNSTGMIGNGEKAKEYFNVNPYEVMTGVDDIKSEGSTIFVFKDNEIWAWGIASNESPYRVYAPVKIATDAFDANYFFDGFLSLQKDRIISKNHVSFTFEFDDVSWFTSSSDVGVLMKNDGSLWGFGSEPLDPSDQNMTGHYGIKELNDREYWWEFSAVQLAGPDSSPITANNQDTVQEEQPAKSATANPTSAKVLVNGVVTTFDAYEINGNNYFKLRDVAHVLSGTEKQFEVTWDGAKSAINLIPNQAYTDVGGEMMAGSGKQQTAKLSTDTVYLNGKQVELTAYAINGNNYFKLRDLGRTFDFAVTWDGASQTIAIDTSAGYTPE